MLRSPWTDGVAIAVVAFLLRLAHLLSLRSLPTFTHYVMDEAYHDTWARQIASGDWLGHEAFFRAPLYPYLLGVIYGLFGAGGTAPRLAQIVIGSLSVLLLHRIALRAGGRAVAAIAASLMALCWPLIYFDNELVITVLEVFLSLATILLLMRADGMEARGGRLVWLACGVTLGLAAIARPNMLLFAPAACLIAALPKGTTSRRSPIRVRLAAPLLLIAGLAATILPVTARNLIVAHDLVLISSQGGVNFFIGNNPESDGTTAVVPGTRPTWEGGYEDAIAIAKSEARADLKASGVSRYWFRRGLDFWRRQPLAALDLLLRKTLLFFGGVEISNNKDLTFFRGLSPILSLPLPATRLLSPLGLLGWTLAWRHRDRRRVMAPALVFAIAYTVSIVVFFVTSRYRAPVLPILALGAALLVPEWAALARRSRPRAAALLAIAAALVVVLNLNLFGYSDDPGQGHLSLAEAYRIAGDHQAALAQLDASIASDGPYLYEAWRAKGDELLALGRATEACDALIASLTTRPGNPEAAASLLEAAVRARRYDEARAMLIAQARSSGPENAAAIQFTLGSSDQRLGRLPEAESEYRAALALQPDHLGARVNLALLLRGQGRLDASLAELREAERSHPDEPVVQINLAKHYLFIGDRQEALRRVERARAHGGVVDPEFERALGRP